MATKAKSRTSRKTAADRVRERGKSAIEDARKRGEKMMKEAQQNVDKTRTAAQKRTAKLAVNVVEFQKSTFDNTIEALGKLQKRSNKMIASAIKEASWLPGEGKDVVDEWVKMMDQARGDFQKTSDKSFDLVIKYLKRLEREAGKAPAKKKASKKKSTKKKATKKKATKKKATKRKTAKRKPAKRKTAAKKKTATSTPSASSS